MGKVKNIKYKLKKSYMTN